MPDGRRQENKISKSMISAVDAKKNLQDLSRQSSTPEKTFRKEPDNCRGENKFSGFMSTAVGKKNQTFISM